MVHQKWGRLVVDGAHGAHLPFLGVDAFAGADVVVCSAHKTLPALGQSSLLFANGFGAGAGAPDDLGVQQLQPVLPHDDLHGRGPGLDGGEGQRLYRRTAERAAALRERFPSLREGSAGPHPPDAERGGRPRPGPGAGGPGSVA